eukprot:864487-Rhodomonas_salina.1
MVPSGAMKWNLPLSSILDFLNPFGNPRPAPRIPLSASAGVPGPAGVATLPGSTTRQRSPAHVTARAQADKKELTGSCCYAGGGCNARGGRNTWGGRGSSSTHSRGRSGSERRVGGCSDARSGWGGRGRSSSRGGGHAGGGGEGGAGVCDGLGRSCGGGGLEDLSLSGRSSS